MLSFIKRKTAELRSNTSGNATLIVALGAPMLIGGAGLGTDMAQWYMWQRELQFAADQAAIAGAWASAETATSQTYATRAEQEFDANLSTIDGFVSEPNIRLANWSGGTLNSVAVSASMTKELPFSSFLTGSATTISVFAQATFEEGATFTSCLLAVDDDADGAITVGGNTVLTAGCGMAALSTSDNAITVSGNPEVQIGTIIAKGGIDDWFDENTDDTILENYQGDLYDPFETLSPPSPVESQVERTYSCSATADTTTATVTTVTDVTYDYFMGSNQRNNVPYAYGTAKEDSTTTTVREGQVVPEGTVDGTSSSSSIQWTNLGKLDGGGNDSLFERKTTVTTVTYSDVLIEAGQPAGNVLPGTYTDIKVSCNTTFATGVYIIKGGGVDITAQYEVTGTNIMFVLLDGAYIKIRGGADINLTAIQASDLIARGLEEEYANKLSGMLVFEDRNDGGTDKNEITGDVETVLNGIIYLPVSNLSFAGTASVTSQCLMIAANTITLTGATNMTNFCPEGSSEETVVAETAAKVRLVA